MATSTTFSAPFLRSLISQDTKIIRPRISFRVKTTYIDNQYDLYSRKCADVLSMIEGVDFTVYYAPVAVIWSLFIIAALASAEGLILFVLDISNAFQNTILPNPAERVCIILPYLFMDWYNIKCPKHPLASINQKGLYIQAIKSIQETKPAEKYWYDLLKSILITLIWLEAPLIIMYSHGYTIITNHSLLLKHITYSWQQRT